MRQDQNPQAPDGAETASARAYDTIRRAIIEGHFEAGQRLKEDELTALCGASRTPIREALKRLAVETLVVLTPHAGAQVANLSAEELEEIYALRVMVESHAAMRAATRISPAALDALAAVQARLEDHAAAGRRRDFVACNAQFHAAVLAAAASPRLSAMARPVVDLPFAVRALGRFGPEDVARSIAHHRELLAAFRARDAAWAESVMRCHIRAAVQVLLRPERPV